MDEARIPQLAAAAARALHEQPVAVLPLRHAGGQEAFVCGFGDGDRRRWLVLDAGGTPMRDRERIHDLASLVAMCEAAEEGAAALAAAEALPALERAAAIAGEAGDAAASLAVQATREALAPLVDAVPGVRVAEAAYLDRMAAAAELVGDRFDLLKEAALAASARLAGEPGEAGEDLAEALWNAVRAVARDGAPDRFREIVEASMGAAAAFADDVIANYATGLEEDR